MRIQEEVEALKAKLDEVVDAADPGLHPEIYDRVGNQFGFRLLLNALDTLDWVLGTTGTDEFIDSFVELDTLWDAIRAD